MRQEMPEALAARRGGGAPRNGRPEDVWLWISRTYASWGADPRRGGVELAVGSVSEADLTAARETVARERRNLPSARPAGQPAHRPGRRDGLRGRLPPRHRLLDARKIRECKAALAEARRHIARAPAWIS